MDHIGYLKRFQFKNTFAEIYNHNILSTGKRISFFQFLGLNIPLSLKEK